MLDIVFAVQTPCFQQAIHRIPHQLDAGETVLARTALACSVQQTDTLRAIGEQAHGQRFLHAAQARKLDGPRRRASRRRLLERSMASEHGFAASTQRAMRCCQQLAVHRVPRLDGTGRAHGSACPAPYAQRLVHCQRAIAQRQRPRRAGLGASRAARVPIAHAHATLGMHRKPVTFQPLKAVHGHIDRHNLIHLKPPHIRGTAVRRRGHAHLLNLQPGPQTKPAHRREPK